MTLIVNLKWIPEDEPHLPTGMVVLLDQFSDEIVFGRVSPDGEFTARIDSFMDGPEGRGQTRELAAVDLTVVLTEALAEPAAMFRAAAARIRDRIGAEQGPCDTPRALIAEELRVARLSERGHAFELASRLMECSDTIRASRGIVNRG